MRPSLLLQIPPKASLQSPFLFLGEQHEERSNRLQSGGDGRWSRLLSSVEPEL